MAETIHRGPVVSLGALLSGTTEPFDGPIIGYHGIAFPDVRYSPAPTVGLVPARVPSFSEAQTVVMVDNLVTKHNVTTLVGAGSATAVLSATLPLNGTAVGGIADGSPGYAPGTPIIPLGTSQVVTVTALDFGFTSGTTAAGSSTVLVPDSTLFAVGQWIVIGGAANAAKTGSLPTQVTSIPNATTIKVSPVCLGALDLAPIGRGNLHGSDFLPPGTQFGPATASANAAVPYIGAGLALLFDARQAVARGVCLSCNTAVGGTAGVTVSGYDVYGQLMTETMTASGTTLVFSKKAFKYISSITALGNGIATYLVGQSDVFGFHLRADTWDATNVSYNNVRGANANGFTASIALNSVSNSVTGDVRGTFQISTAGGLSTSLGLAPTNGTGRLYMTLDVRVPNLIKATPTGGTTSLFGVAQA